MYKTTVIIKDNSKNKQTRKNEMDTKVINDIVNGVFETGGAILNWINVYRLYKDKSVKGVYWPAWAFFAVWGLWNLNYYPALNQWFSFAGGVIMVTANITWTIMAAYYIKKNKKVIPMSKRLK